MISVQTKDRIEDNGDGTTITVQYVVIDNIADEDSTYHFHIEKNRKFVYLFDERVIQVLLNYSFKNLENHFTIIEYSEQIAKWDDGIRINIYCNEYFEKKIPQIRIELNIPNLEHWTNPWSMASLVGEFKNNILKLKNDKFKYFQDEIDDFMGGFGIEYFPDSSELILKNEMEIVLTTLNRLIDLTNKDLLTYVDKDSLLTYFNFPEGIKTVCKQYLIYFAQFIADLGINIETEIEEELNHTLFRIIPRDKTEGLERIKKALDVYLRAPSNKDFHQSIIDYKDISIKQWEANVYHLKSQLTLANSIYQANQATIQLLELSNYQYKQQLEIKDTKDIPSKEEDLVKGIVAIKKYEGKMFSVDFAEILRRLKRKFIK